MGLSEADTRVKLIDPRLAAAGWTEGLIEREFPYKRGRVRLVGEQSIRDQPKFVDYVLRDGPRGPILAVVEAKDEDHQPSDGLQQALDYAADLGVFFAYSSNGHGLVEHDRINATITELDTMPSREELAGRLAAGRQTRGPVVANPYGEQVPNPIIQAAWPSPTGGMRWYQERAVTAVLDAMLRGNRRALLSLATGTGKTFIAFNLAWKLIHSRYARKVLFLADRVSLRDQAFNEFGPFEKARAVTSGQAVPLARDIHFGIYQGLYSRGEDGLRAYQRYPRDYFDLVVVDECHRSGYGDWQVILDHFSTAFHLGMTATPKRTDNIDTYEFFAGENRDADGVPQPVFEYSLGRGIDDGFLATYRVRRVRTNIDRDGLRIDEELELGADLIAPEGAEVRDIYTSADFERAIVVDDRTRMMCDHLAGLLRGWGTQQKTMVFCVTMDHAARVRDHLQAILGPETGKELYAARIVSEEPAGQALLEEFQLSSSTQPVVATTVDLLSTGVNVPACRNIVFMKPIGSPTVFKQILGRGSRLDAATGKEFFRIVDYTNATRLLDEWDLPPSDASGVPETGNGVLAGRVVVHDDGDPIFGAAVVVRSGMRTLAEAKTDAHGLFHLSELPEAVLTVDVGAHGFTKRRIRIPVSPEGEQVVVELRQPSEGAEKVVISGVTVSIAEETELTLGSGEELTVEQYIDHAGERIRTATGDDVGTLTELWRDPDKRRVLREQLRNGDVDPEIISVLLGRPDADEYDLLAFAGYSAEIHSREERARRLEHIDAALLNTFSGAQRRVVEALIDKYRLAGVEEIASAEVFSVAPFVEDFGGVQGLIRIFGGPAAVAALLRNLQAHLYDSDGEDAA